MGLWQARAALAALLVCLAGSAFALDKSALEKLANGENDQKVEAIGALVAEADPRAIGVLTRFAAGEVELDGNKVEVMINNRLRSAVADALAALRLLSPERGLRLAAAKELPPERVELRVALAGQTFTAPSGITSTMDAKNHHLHKAVFIGEVKADGQFNVVWKTKGPVKAQPWSPFIAGNDKKKDEPALMAEKKK